MLAVPIASAGSWHKPACGGCCTFPGIRRELSSRCSGKRSRGGPRSCGPFLQRRRGLPGDGGQAQRDAGEPITARRADSEFLGSGRLPCVVVTVRQNGDVGQPPKFLSERETVAELGAFCSPTKRENPRRAS